MAELKLPLSGNVSQLISPWTAWLSAFGSQIGLVNVNLGQSSAPEVERKSCPRSAATANSSVASETC